MVDDGVCTTNSLIDNYLIIRDGLISIDIFEQSFLITVSSRKIVDLIYMFNCPHAASRYSRFAVIFNVGI